MQISEIRSLPSSEFFCDGTRWTASTPGGLVAVQAQKVVNALMKPVPPGALITIGKYQIISQKWLLKQAPHAGFFEEGQSVNPPPGQTDDTKRQCWEDNGIYTYNEIGSQWMLNQLGFRTPSYDEIVIIHTNAQGNNNTEKMESMGVVATGWRDGGDGSIVNAEFAYLRSGSPSGGGGMLTAKLRPDGSDVGWYGFKPRRGMVPFGVMDTPVSA